MNSNWLSYTNNILCSRLSPDALKLINIKTSYLHKYFLAHIIPADFTTLNSGHEREKVGDKNTSGASDTVKEERRSWEKT